ncbi:uncharacterized protein L969DRAFT_50068, partial [Mixia osmundae IAM 14324]|uniref:uncharacterized protein n=1 Tax=Mixia osmundae (strain CBS 9802 / IAM 14324 / JCM 22182 / KY 12970) TaxID=764103 RepID=UPI0004A5496C
PFSGIHTFAHLPYLDALANSSERFDFAIFAGVPFDGSVSYRPGARFGPQGIRTGSRRQRPGRGYSIAQKIDPYDLGLKIIDAGDVPLSPYDPAIAMQQLQTAYRSMLNRRALRPSTAALAADGIARPRVLTLGGDHSIVLPILRELYQVYGPISVIHFDAHLDTWDPAGYAGADSPTSQINHGTMFHVAHKEGLLGPCIHAGIRTRLGKGDLEHDSQVGFTYVTTDDIDDLGADGVADALRARVGSKPVYLSVDIDVVDPSMAPATGTPESGGFTSRELKKMLRGLVGLNFVGMDLVEVSPAYDTNAELTTMLAADLIHEILSVMVQSQHQDTHAHIEL